MPEITVKESFQQFPEDQKPHIHAVWSMGIVQGVNLAATIALVPEADRQKMMNDAFEEIWSNMRSIEDVTPTE